MRTGNVRGAHMLVDVSFGMDTFSCRQYPFLIVVDYRLSKRLPIYFPKSKRYEPMMLIEMT
jgi:hypothetical protein